VRDWRSAINEEARLRAEKMVVLTRLGPDNFADLTINNELAQMNEKLRVLGTKRSDLTARLSKQLISTLKLRSDKLTMFDESLVHRSFDRSSIIWGFETRYRKIASGALAPGIYR